MGAHIRQLQRRPPPAAGPEEFEAAVTDTPPELTYGGWSVALKDLISQPLLVIVEILVLDPSKDVVAGQ
jgi:hypothetical protein